MYRGLFKWKNNPLNTSCPGDVPARGEEERKREKGNARSADKWPVISPIVRRRANLSGSLAISSAASSHRKTWSRSLARHHTSQCKHASLPSKKGLRTPFLSLSLSLTLYLAVCSSFFLRKRSNIYLLFFSNYSNCFIDQVIFEFWI